MDYYNFYLNSYCCMPLKKFKQGVIASFRCRAQICGHIPSSHGGRGEGSYPIQPRKSGLPLLITSLYLQSFRLQNCAKFNTRRVFELSELEFHPFIPTWVAPSNTPPRKTSSLFAHLSVLSPTRSPYSPPRSTPSPRAAPTSGHPPLHLSC